MQLEKQEVKKEKKEKKEIVANISINERLTNVWKRIRYWIVRLIGVPAPSLFSSLFALSPRALSNSLPGIGGRSVIELVMIAVAFYFGITFALEDYEDAGIICDYALAITVGLGFRTNAITIFFGMSYERVLYWHKVMGFVSIAVTIVHAFEGWTNPTGLPMLIIMLGMLLTYLIKIFPSLSTISQLQVPYSFQLFYYVHLIGILLLIVFSFLHYAQVFPYVLLVWFVDLSLRYLITLKKITATATLLPDGLIRLKFDKCFEYSSGQYCFLYCKELSPIDFHPFSISSSPEEKVTAFHIRQYGTWTKGLANLIKSRAASASQSVGSEVEDGKNESERDLPSIQLDFCVEGPYGSPMIDIESPEYEVLLLVSGGIGITPLQSMYNHFIHQSATGQRKFRKVIFIWSVRDRAMVDAMHGDKLHSTANTSNQHTPYLPISFQPTMTPPPPMRSSVHHSHSAQHVIPTTSSITPPLDHPESDLANGHSILPQEDNVPDNSADDDLLSDLIFYNEYYLTQVRAGADAQHSAGIHPDVQKWLKFGRPNMGKVFQRVSSLCQKEGIPRVAVCVCGPQPMVNEVTDLCHHSLLHPSCDTIRFDCHHEVFDF